MRFQAKIFLVFTSAMLVLVGGLLYVSYRFERDLLMQVETGVQNMVRSVNLSTLEIGKHETHTLETLRDFMQRCRTMPGVERVSIINNHARIILSTDSLRVGDTAALPGHEEMQARRRPPGRVHDARLRYDLHLPIVRAGKVIGAVWLVIAVADYPSLFRELSLKVLALALVGLMLALVFSRYFLNRFTRPLTELSQAAKRVSEGDLGVRLPPTGGEDLAEVSRTFNAMAVQLEEKKRLEDRVHSLERHALVAEMAAHLAHEIRNPLNLIHLSIDQLQHEWGPRAAPGQHELLLGAKEASRHLDHVVTRFLNLGKPGRLDRQSFSLLGLVNDLRLLLGQRLREKGVTLECRFPDTLALQADPEQMRLLLLNLLLNALAVLPSGGTLVIAAERHESPRGPEVLLSVSDNGPGIAPEDLQQVFEPYFTRRQGGTGLGLALVRRIAEEHGGTALASNLPQGGACLTIQLPDTPAGTPWHASS